MADPVSLAITVALNAATMAMTMMNKTEGPRLEDLSVSTADYGTPLAQFYGTKRLELPCFFAEDIREEKDEQKGKGGKYTQYKYYGTWASFIADHEIKDVLKLWLDRHLCLDRTKQSGKIAQLLGLNVAVKLKMGDNVRLYKGTEDQLPDPRMLATIEEKEGVGRCPAYLGVAYGFFEEIPLEKFGNRLPQVSGVFTRPDPEPSFPFERVVQTDAGLNTQPRYSKDHNKLVVQSGELVDLWTLPNRRRQTTQVQVDGASSPMGVLNDGSFYCVGINGISGGNVFLCTAFGASTQLVNGRTDDDHTHTFFSGCEYVANTLCIYPAGLVQASYGLLGADALGAYIQGVDPGFVPTHFFGDEDEIAWAVGADRTTNNVYFTPVNISAGGLTALLPRDPGDVAAVANGNNQFVVYSTFGAGWLYLIDRETGAVDAEFDMTPTGFPTVMGRTVMAAAIPGTTSLWFENYEISTEDLTVERTIDFTDWAPDPASFTLYDPNNHALISHQFLFGTHWIWRFLDRKLESSTTLGDICTDVALQAGFEEDEFDFLDLDQPVLGFGWTQGPAKEVIGALLEIHDSDIGPHGWIQRGIKRGQELAGPPISSDWMIPTSDSEGGRKPLWRIPMTAETDLPRDIYATFSDPLMDEQPNTARTARPVASVKTKRTASFDLQTLSIYPDIIQPLLDRALRRYWIGATKPECSVSPLEIRTEPGDVRMFYFEAEPLRCRVIRTNIRANRVIDLELELDGETPVNVPDWQSDSFSPLNTVFASPGGVTEGRPPEELSAPVPTKGFLIDVALLRDTDDQTAPFINVAAGKDFDGFWPGAVVWTAESAEEEFAAGWDGFASDQYSTYGYTVNALPDALSTVIDYGTQLQVYMPNGFDLSSITEAAMLDSATANLAVIGNEVVQFCEVTQIDDTSGTVSGFIRGARGTEWAIPDHAVAERFVMIGANTRTRTVGASEIGDTDVYRFLSLGFDSNSPGTETHELLFRANAHRPLSVVQVALGRDAGSGDWSGTWLRRTRVGGSALNGQDVPLGETTEAYRVRVLDPETLITVRIIDTVAEAFTYTNAQQVVDFGAVVDRLVVDICQMSPALSLEGFATRADKTVGSPQLLFVGDMVATGGTGSCDVPFPDEGTAPKQVAIMQVLLDASPAVTIATPEGWEEIAPYVADGTDSFKQYAFQRRLDGNEGDEVEVEASSSSATIRARISVWGGAVQSGNPIEGAGSTSGADGTAESPAVTTEGDSRTVINLVGLLGLVTAEPPAGYTEGYDESDATVGTDMTMTMNSKAVASASTVPAAATTFASTFWNQHSFALIPSEA